MNAALDALTIQDSFEDGGACAARYEVLERGAAEAYQKVRRGRAEAKDEPEVTRSVIARA